MDEIKPLQSDVEEKLTKGDILGALEVVRRILRADPFDETALGQLSALHFILRDSPAAIQDFQEALRLNPKASNVRRSLAAAYREGGRLEEAEQEYDRELIDRAVDSVALYCRAQVRRERGKLQGACEDMKRVTELEPSGRNWAQLAGIEVEMGNIKEAEPHYDEAVRLSPEWWFHRLDRGALRIHLENWKGAEEDFDFVLETSPDNEECGPSRRKAYANRGWCRLMQKKDGARADLDNALLIDPTDPATLCYSGFERMVNGDLKAVDHLDAAIENDPNLAFVYAIRGDFHLRIGKDQVAALRDYRRAIELDPAYRDSLQASIKEAEKQE